MAALLLDTYSLFFRAYYALPPMNTRAGLETRAVYGFSSLLLKLLREEAPSGVALALDGPEATFRQREFAAYKAQRPALPRELVQQLGLLDELIDALGFPAHKAPGFEADDVLATLARELSGGGERVLIVSGDRDMLQLVRDTVEVLFVGQRGKPPIRHDPARVLERFGVHAPQLPAYVALVGDPSDNIPKVKGIGAVAAQKLVAAYGDITSLLLRLNEVAPARLRDLLAANAEQLRLSESLVQLRDELDLGSGPRVAKLERAALERTRALFEAWEFRSLLPRLNALADRCE